LKIAIVGAGITGAYLYRLLDKKKDSVHVFDKSPGTQCGISPCAWGTSRGFEELIKSARLDPLRYMLRRFDYVIMDGLRIKADLMTFNKQKLIKDLLKGATISHSRPNLEQYDRIIDSSGVSRSLLPTIPNDIILSCAQFRIQSKTQMSNQIKLGRIGYAWCFPLSHKEYHIGCGSLDSDPRKILKGLGWMKHVSKEEVRCYCRGTIRLTAPEHSQPFVALDQGHHVWGVGEAIGCVAPLAGDGIVPGMRSVQILLEHWDNPPGYTKAILKEFKWMAKERGVIDKLRSNDGLRVGDAWVLRKNSRRMGMEVGLKEAIHLLHHLQ
jgi:hypothetical protein